MRASRSIAIVVTALAVCGAVVVAIITTRSGQCYARSYFKVDIKQTNHFPDFFGSDANVLRVLLDSREGRQVLATAAGVNERGFALRKIGPTRGTALGCLEYSGINSNLVEQVASNAAMIVVHFYATNQPGWEVTYVNSYCFTPPTPWERLETIWSHFRYMYLQ